ncbi:MAG: RNA polymerase sigma factor [Fimbriiglobus sp.]
MSLPETPVTLLDRLRGRPDPADWDQFHAIYAPLLRRWLATVPGLGGEAGDIAQDVLSAVVWKLPEFERRRHGAFRAWLRAIVVNRVRQHWRDRDRRPTTGAEDVLAQLADPSSDLAASWDRDHDRPLFDRLLDAVRRDFDPRTWEAFTRFAVAGEPASQVANALGLSPNAVVLAKARVLKRLREEAGGLID